MSSKGFKIFVVEDNEWYSRLLVHNLSLNPDFEVVSYLSGKECLENIGDMPDVITLDYRLPDISGEEVLKQIKRENEDIHVIIISEQDDIEVVVSLLKAGAYDYIVKTNDIGERLLNTVNNIYKKATLNKEVVSLRKEVQQKYDFQKSIIGSSPAIARVFDLIEKAVRTNITVSVFGETGTGKEVVAKAIHYSSKRKDRPFVAVNVAAIPSELIESELFGHEKGAFTGANNRRIGKFEEADGGTLFLDEVAEMDMSFQAKLLRALQEKEVTRVGSNKSVKTDCRIIVATNKNLQEQVKKGKFREDLYYRLFGLSIELPPLRERDKDVLILAKHFIIQFCRENDLEPKQLSNEAQKKILNYNFPGNVRELRSVVELAATIASGEEITGSDILLSTNDLMPELLSDELTLREYERKILKSFLDRYDNDTKLVAEKLDIGVSTIYRMLKEEKEEQTAE